jgi:hypothetical protein
MYYHHPSHQLNFCFFFRQKRFQPCIPCTWCCHEPLCHNTVASRHFFVIKGRLCFWKKKTNPFPR